LEEALRKGRGNKTATAEMLGLKRKVEEFGSGRVILRIERAAMKGGCSQYWPPYMRYSMIILAAFSAIMKTEALVFPRTILGITDASTTRRAPTPWT